MQRWHSPASRSTVTQAADLQRSSLFRHIEVKDFDTPADAAESVREEWNVPAGPIDDLVALLEDVGALVVVRDLGTTELDAVSQWPPGKAPLVLLNSERLIGRAVGVDRADAHGVGAGAGGTVGDRGSGGLRSAGGRERDLLPESDGLPVALPLRGGS
jgi:hypothetical protein